MLRILMITALLYIASFADVKEISNDGLQAYISKRIVVVDIRTEKQWNNTGIIPGSYKINFFNEQGKSNKKRWLYIFARLVRNKSTLFVLISKEGKEAKEVAKILEKEVGYQNIFYLENGIEGWIDDERKVIDF